MQPAPIGELFHEGVAKLVNPNVQISDYRLTRTSGRAIEEMVELCLACGLTPEKILGHVMDALYNEGRKFDCFPTDLQVPTVPSAAPGNIKVEIVDVTILVDYVRFLANIKESDIARGVFDKIDLLHYRAKAGELKEHDELIYKASLNRS